jgi:hypothetical protein
LRKHRKGKSGRRFSPSPSSLHLPGLVFTVHVFDVSSLPSSPLEPSIPLRHRSLDPFLIITSSPSSRSPAAPLSLPQHHATPGICPFRSRNTLPSLRRSSPTPALRAFGPSGSRRERESRVPLRRPGKGLKSTFRPPLLFSLFSSTLTAFNNSKNVLSRLNPLLALERKIPRHPSSVSSSFSLDLYPVHHRSDRRRRCDTPEVGEEASPVLARFRRHLRRDFSFCVGFDGRLDGFASECVFPSPHFCQCN